MILYLLPFALGKHFTDTDSTVTMPGYYEDLSGCSSANDSGDSDSDNERKAKAQSTPSIGEKWSTPSTSATTTSASRCILHVDVDSFYCQCEMMDRNIPEERPLAIRQKHIIVTCNYAARSYGVKKLELTENALRKCPCLLIVDGSDLSRYRIHARKIYDCFRAACKKVHADSPVAKGSMDEMMADLTLACNITDAAANFERCRNDEIYVYGDQNQERTTLTEDQTGQSVVVVEKRHTKIDTPDTDPPLMAKLYKAASLAKRIRSSILQDTGFRVTVGASTNPLLAKLASGLKKPGIVNVLYPWRSAQLLERLPLRKMHGAGRRTLQVLKPCLLRNFPGRPEPIVWTCRDLRAVPGHEIASCLAQLPHRESGHEQARRILLKCRGVDDTPVIDDDGGLPKTVSVESSFRRGTIVTGDAIELAAWDLCKRLPDLLRARCSISNRPALAYPSTLRLSVRLVAYTTDQQRYGRRRPFVTCSRQMACQGRALIGTEDAEMPGFLWKAMEPLLRSLVLEKPPFDVTRLNLAVTGFHDLDAGSGDHVTSPSKVGTRGVAEFIRGSQPSPSPGKQVRDTPEVSHHVTQELISGSRIHAEDIDPTVLEELPPDIRTEIEQSYGLVQAKKLSRKKRRIDDFFKPIKGTK